MAGTDQAPTPQGDDVGSRIDTVRRLALGAETHLREGRLTLAAELFHVALDLWPTLGAAERAVLGPGGVAGGVTEAGLHSGLGTAAFRAGDYAEALARFERALRLNERSGTAQLIATILCNLGVVRRQLGDLDGALADYERAREIEQRHGHDPAEVAIIINNIARVLRMRGDREDALGHFLEALAMIPDESAYDSTRSAVLNNIAGCHLDGGDFATAIDYYRRALDIVSAIAADSAETARCRNNLGYAYKMLGDDGRALVEYEHALRVDERIAPRSVETARDLLNIAGVHRDKGDQARALDCYERARRLLEAAAPQSLEMATCLTNLGGLRSLDGDLDEALVFFRAALAIDEALGPDGSEVGTDHNNIGDVLLEQGDLDGAVEHLLLARRIHRAVSAESLDSAIAAHNLARALWRRGDRPAAIAELRQAVDIADSLRARAGADWARESMLAQYEAAFVDLVHWLQETGDLRSGDDAFAVVERFRARVLLDLLNERRLDDGQRDDGQPDDGQPDARIGAASHDQLFAQERRLADRLAAAFARRRLAERERRAEDALQAAQMEHDTVEELDRVRATMRRVHPAYANLRAPVPAGLDGVRGELRDDELMLSYLLTPEDSFVWAVRRDATQVFRLEERSERISELVEAALRPYRGGGLAGDGVVHGLLARALLGPISREFWHGTRRLTVVPSGTLAYLPVEMLPFGTGTLILDRLAVAYCPSATVFVELRRPRPTPGSWRSRQFVGYADPEGPRESARGPAPAPASASAAVAASPVAASPLPAARREVGTVAGAFGAAGAWYAGSAVTADRILATAGTYRFVHFATHAVINDENPLYSGLVVTPGPGPERAGGLFHMYEMLRLRLSAEVVVCSACQSGIGPVRTGEGLIGMGRAFIAAGAGSVVLTSWPVPDAPTARLIRRFYDQLRAGGAPVDALAAAKRHVRRTHPRLYAGPFTWAGFLLTGAG